MSLSDRRAVLLGASALALSQAGCLRPMLAEGSAASGLRGRILYPEFEDRFGYFLDQSLRDQLGRPGAEPSFRLDLDTQLSERGTAISQDNSVTRVTVLAEANWALRRATGPEAVLSGDVSAQSGYNATTSLFATRQVRLDIERRLARDLGERIARVLLARAPEITG